MKPEVSIIIVNWNTKDYIRECIQSIYDNDSELEAQIIVIDGASYDGCGSMLEAEFPAVRYIQLDDNAGFGKCNNIAANEAEADILIFLNPDTKLHDNALSNLSKQLSDLPDAGLIGPRLLNTDSSLQESSVHAFPTPINQAIDSLFLRKLLPKSKFWNSYHALRANSPTPVQALSGACLVTYTDFFYKIGGFSKAFFMYSEDIDLSLKSQQAGKKNYHIPNIEITHLGGGSSALQYSQFSTIAPRNSICIYFDKNHDSLMSHRYKFLMTISALIRLPLLYMAKLITKRENEYTEVAIKRWITILKWSLQPESHIQQPTNAL